MKERNSLAILPGRRRLESMFSDSALYATLRSMRHYSLWDIALYATFRSMRHCALCEGLTKSAISRTFSNRFLQSRYQSRSFSKPYLSPSEQRGNIKGINFLFDVAAMKATFMCCILLERTS